MTEPLKPERGADTTQADTVSEALRRAWQLGQAYWQQADSDYASQNRKSDETQRTFEALVDDTRALLAAAPTPVAHAGAMLTDSLSECVRIIEDNRKRIGYAIGSPNDKAVKRAKALIATAPTPVADSGASDGALNDLLPNALWTRHGSDTCEWWSFKGYEARKDGADQWVLRKAGQELYRHTYLQVVMAHAEREILALATAPAPADAPPVVYIPWHQRHQCLMGQWSVTPPASQHVRYVRADAKPADAAPWSALSPEARAFYARHETRMGRNGPAKPADAPPVAHAGASEELRALPWLDDSTADPIEKARRVLGHLIEPNAVYYYGDGFPRPDIRQQAGNVLAVLNALAAAPAPGADVLWPEPNDGAAVFDDASPAAAKPVSVFHGALVREMCELCDVADESEMAGCIERALARCDYVIAPRALLAAATYPGAQHDD